MNINKLEELRVHSQLSETIHFIELDGRHYTCMCGIALPYNISMMIIMAVMAGRVYHRVFSSASGEFMSQIDEIREINPYDIAFSQKIPSSIGHHLANEFQKHIFNWTPEQLNNLIPYNLPNLQNRD